MIMFFSFSFNCRISKTNKVPSYWNIPIIKNTQVFIAHVGEQAKSEAIIIAGELHREGISAVVAFEGRSLKSQLKLANSSGSRFAIIIGDEEMGSGSVLLRDMDTARQYLIDRQNVSFTIRQQLNELSLR